MVTPRRSITKGRWIRGFIVAFLASTAAILLTAKPVIASDKATAKPVIANVWELSFNVKDGKEVKKMVIKVDEAKDQVSATVDGEPVKVSEKIPFPVKLGDHSRILGAIYPGPVIVFEGSYCVWVKNRWIGPPPCP